jgi:nitroreductase
VNVTDVIEDRRSVHDYTDEPLDDETLETIFERVKHTPSGYNLQPWQFLVLRDEENQERLRGHAFDQDHVTGAAAAVVVLGNTDPAAHAGRVFDDWLDKGYLPDAETRDGLVDQVEGWRERAYEENRVWSTRSTALAAMTLMYAAWEEGVASCPMEGFDPEGVKEEFDIGAGYEPVMLLTLGYPEEDATDTEKPRKLRRPPEEMVHFEAFDPEPHAEPAAEVTEAAEADATASDD